MALRNTLKSSINITLKDGSVVTFKAREIKNDLIPEDIFNQEIVGSILIDLEKSLDNNQQDSSIDYDNSSAPSETVDLTTSGSEKPVKKSVKKLSL